MLKQPKLVAMMAQLLTFAGLKEPPIVDGKVAFDEAATKKFNELLTEKVFSEALAAFNADIADATEADAIKASVIEVLKELEIPQAQLDQIITDAKEQNGTDAVALIKSVQSTLVDYKAKQDKIIKKLENASEEDIPIDEITQKLKSNMKHSATHLFSSGKDYDAIDASRPWNKAASDGLDTSATDFANEVVIQKLNGDADLYFRENPTDIKSLHRDNFMLPIFWPKRLKVDHMVSDGSIVTGEITQGRKFGWLPKNVQEIQAETGMIYPVQIDAEWSGFDLQKIETSWLNMMNKEGSQPEKMTFVRFLVGELMKKARVEDRISTLNGIFVQTPKTATQAGKFINRQNGLFYQLYKAREIDKKYRAFSMSSITPENVMDWFHSEVENSLGFVNRLPQDVLSATNGVVYMHYKVWEFYRAKYKQINGTNMDYKGLPDHLDNKPNIRVETFVDQESKDFVFFTFDDNIEILENIPQEKSAYKFQIEKRNILLLGDYKLGVRMIHIGNPVASDSPDAFKVQSVWSNDAPIFLDTKFIPVFDDLTGVLKLDYKNVMVDNSWNTDITSIANPKPGQIIKIKGNTAIASSKKVKHDSAKMVLVSGADFDLQNGGTLTLKIDATYKAVEIKRTAAPSVVPNENITFSTTTFDADLGFTYAYKGASAATLADIDNGAEGKTITIYGKTSAALTVANVAGLIVVGTSVVLDSDAKFLELIKVDGIWYKGNTNA